MAKFLTKVLALTLLMSLNSLALAFHNSETESPGQVNTAAVEAISMAKANLNMLIQQLDEASLALGYLGEAQTFNFGQRIYQAQFILDDAHATLFHIEGAHEDLILLKKELGL